MSWTDYWNTAKSWFGYRPDQKVGKDLGRYLGQLGSEYIPIPGVNGSQFGEWIGSFLPFKEGGIVSSDYFDKLDKLMMKQDQLGPFPRFKEGGRIPPLSFSNIPHYSFSNILAQMKDERPELQPYKKGGKVRRRKA